METTEASIYLLMLGNSIYNNGAIANLNNSSGLCVLFSGDKDKRGNGNLQKKSRLPQKIIVCE